ncbi:hypothetical protein BVX97_03725 [bacterium E08(2017)]|nr:hypothetical protein BVX97_03725 [bacterium E08(2017)]
MTTDTEKAWLCTVCGYVHRGPEPPDCCPVCGTGTSDFEAHEEPQTQPATKEVSQWRCRNCNYIHHGSKPDEPCPVCGVPPSEYEPIEEPSDSEQASGQSRIIIIGAGIAGVAAAESARKHAPNAIIDLLTAEPRSPYYRLNLTRYLAGEINQDSLPIYPDSWYSENAITLHSSCKVESLSTENKTISLAKGDNMEYDKLILATGSHAFVPPIPGSDLPGVMTLRTAEDAEAILAKASERGECTVIGGGILGIEIAGALARQNTKVTLLESHEWMMPRQLNKKAASRMEAHLDSLGISLRKETRTQAIEGEESVNAVRLQDGTAIQTSMVILATGVRPNSSLARKAGLEVNRGILVNNHMRTSSDDIYAAGDVAEHNGLIYGIWAPSQYQGSIAGMNAVGISTEFGGLPRSNSLKILGIDFLSIGQFEPEDGSFLVIDHEDDNGFAHFVFRDGRMKGCILLGYPGIGQGIKKAIEDHTNFSGLLSNSPTGLQILNSFTE